MWRAGRLAWLGLGAVAIAFGVHRRAPPPRAESGLPALAPLMARGAHWSEIGRPYRAVQAYLRAVRMAPDHADAWAALGAIAATAGQAGNAHLAAQHAAALRPGDLALEALRVRAAALPPPPSMRPGRPRALTRRRCAAAQRLFERGRVAEAILGLEAAAWLDERAARPYRDLANVYYLQGQLADAASAQRAAVVRAPRSEALRRNLAALEARLAAATTPSAHAD
ncbi:MAG: hypothetical protein ABI629_09060 [bacterium]